MRKGTRIVKRLLDLFLVVLMSIESFGAVVSGNDGSAFVTKAEFETLKNDFAQQVANYNKSIDGKIDGAIGNYLAGIKLNNTERIRLINSANGGVLSANTNDLKWKEGQMSLQLHLTVARTGKKQNFGDGSKNRGFMIFEWPGGDRTKFTEQLVESPDYATGNAGWYGLCETEQYGEFVSVNMGGGDSAFAFPGNKDFSTGASVHMYNWQRLTNRDLSVGGVTGVNIMNGQISQAGEIDGNDWNVNSQDAWFDRKIIQEKYNNVILTPISMSATKLSNKAIRDFCNQSDDSTDTDHSKVGTVYPEFGNGTANIRISNGNNTYNFYHFENVQPFKYSGYTGIVKPYLGFVLQLDNYNKLWTNKYDGYITDMKKYDTNLWTIKDTKNVEHLAIGAGFPLFFAKTTNIVTFPIEFEDKTKNYDVWLKVGSFRSNVEVTSDTNCIAPNTITGGNTSTKTNATLVKNGKATLKFEMPKDGYIFMKWSLSSSMAGGGGLLLPPEYATLELQ